MHRPSAAVAAIVERYYSSLPVAADKAVHLHSSLIGIHVRMNSNVYDEVSDHRDPSLALAVPFRLSCHWRNFDRRLHALTHTPTAVFVASDTGKAVQGIGRGTSVYSLPQCGSRNTTCMQVAAADAVLLSRCGHVLLSRWSAFSEVAARAGSHLFDYACDEPEGGWQVGNGKVLKQQVAQYLDKQAYAGKDVVMAAYQQLL